MGKKRPAMSYALKAGHITWQRPTLTEPIALLPLALHRFTAVFGMGTGGSNALWSPGAELMEWLLGSIALSSGSWGP